MIVPANTLSYYSQVWLRHDKVLKGWSLHKGDVQNIFYILTDIRLLQQKKLISEYKYEMWPIAFVIFCANSCAAIIYKNNSNNSPNSLKLHHCKIA